MKKLLVFLFIISVWSLGAEEFRFKYVDEDRFRVLSQVQEDVYINGAFSHHARILNKVNIHINEVADGTGTHITRFQTFEEGENFSGVHQWSKEYESIYKRDPRGYFTIGDQYFMPIVRNVPIFPEESIEPGDSWTHVAEEVHDFSTGFGIQEPYRFPITVQYTYEGDREVDGQVFATFLIEYTLFHRPEPRYSTSGTYPVRITGYSKQRMFWSRELGQPQYYTEVFEFVFTLSSGDVFEFTGTSSAEILEVESINRRQVMEDFQNIIEDGEVVENDRGVTLRIENILFPPDSPELRAYEKEKLLEIAEALKSFPDHDILVSGHTALDGNTDFRMRLSEARAKAVAEFLLSQGVTNVYYEGLGSSDPLESNRTEEGRKKNRRVEITILE